LSGRWIDKRAGGQISMPSEPGRGKDIIPTETVISSGACAMEIVLHVHKTEEIS
jgi:hypothetical protein